MAVAVKTGLTRRTQEPAARVSRLKTPWTKSAEMDAPTSSADESDRKANDPSLAEIAARAEQIRRGWASDDYRVMKARGTEKRAPGIRVYSEADLPLSPTWRT